MQKTLDKNNLIEITFLRLGKSVGKYGNNDDEDYYKAGRMLDEIIENIALETEFRFNATTVVLNKNIDETGVLGDNRFNLPVDFLNLISCEQDIRIEGEYIYSEESSVTMIYCRKIELTEFPLYMKRFLISYLCYELSIILKYLDKTALFKKEMILEKTRIINLQGLIVKEW